MLQAVPTRPCLPNCLPPSQCSLCPFLVPMASAREASEGSKNSLKGFLGGFSPWIEQGTSSRSLRHESSGRPRNEFRVSPTALTASGKNSRRRHSTAMFSRCIWLIYRSEEHTSELQSHSDLVCRL